MLDTLWLIFKCSLLIFGILVVASVILSILTEPFKRKKAKKEAFEALDKLTEIAKYAKKANEEEKTSAKKPRNTKKKEEK